MGCASSTPAEKLIDPIGPGFHWQYALGSKLGEGAFGQVRSARHKKDHRELAVKIIDLRNRDEGGEVLPGINKELKFNTIEEITVWTRMGKGDHVVRLLVSFMDGDLCFMVMEKCTCSLMEKFEHSPTDVSLPDVFKQMLQGISHVHQKGVVHRDIKPDNFLCGDNGITIKLCDFGLAAPLPKSGKLNGVFGTPPYMSPEMLSQQDYNTLTDVWSFGACAHLMVFGRWPYLPERWTANGMKQAIKADKPKLEFSTPSGDPLHAASQFVKAILQRAAGVRLSAEAAMELDFLKPKPAAAEVCDSLDAAPALRKARKITNQTKEFVAPINPIVQRSIDELMRQLLLEGKLESQGTRFFSEGEEEPQASRTKSEPEDDRIKNRTGLRKSTHSGVMSGTLSSSCLTPTTLAANAEGSTTEGSDDGELSMGGSSTAGSKDSKESKDNLGSKKGNARRDSKKRSVGDVNSKNGMAPDETDEGIKSLFVLPSCESHKPNFLPP